MIYEWVVVQQNSSLIGKSPVLAIAFEGLGDLVSQSIHWGGYVENIIVSVLSRGHKTEEVARAWADGYRRGWVRGWREGAGWRASTSMSSGHRRHSMETADDYKILYGLLSAYRGQVLDEADRLGADGVPDEAASRLADVDVLDAALDIIKTDAELRFPADTVVP